MPEMSREESSMNATIARATLEQLDVLVPLFDAYRQSYGQPADADGARTFLTERITRNQSVVFLSLSDGQGLGFTQLYPAFSSVALRPIWILNDLFVAPESRRTGIGKSLLRAAREFAVEQGAKRLELCTAPDNRQAQALYAKHGWARDDAFLHYKLEL
jgi:GNAT superfamily N-acetyltransferase